MRVSWAVAMVIGIVACHRGPEVQPWPHREIGDYAYRTMVGATKIEGGFTIEADTVTLDARMHSCRRVPTGIIDPLVHPFRCAGGPTSFNIVIDSKRPAWSTWSSEVSVTKTRQVCDRYTTTKEGRTVCAVTRTQVYTENERIGGRLDVTRVASADKP